MELGREGITYAPTAKMAVTIKTSIESMRFTSVPSEYEHMPIMMNRLKAAEPTIVPGPRSPE
jgi:hypothetical protein